MESIIQNWKECYVCKTPYDLHSHHIFFGTANRAKSEKYGMKIWLCGMHHNMSAFGIHYNKKLDLQVKQEAQRIFEERIGSRQFFRQEFGKSWL